MSDLVWIIHGVLTLFLCGVGLTIDTDELHALQEECRDGTFGYKCNSKCRCKRYQTCDKVTGECIRDECEDNGWGPGCQLSNNCFYNGQAMTYLGTKSITSDLYQCQRWDLQIPHRHSYKSAEQFPDKTMPENYCRTTEDSARPWCYTTDINSRWEHCNINNCNCPAGRFGDNCIKECHCADLSEACDSILGICSSGCAQGWDGYDCQQAIACPQNRFGWDCSKRCFCQDSRHCNRFTGPSKQCHCISGYFNPPFCQAVTPPTILSFENTEVNPGQNTTLNCTVTAYPTPKAGEIIIRGPARRRVTLMDSGELEIYMYTRFNLYAVEYVNAGDRFTCIVNSVAGTTSTTITAGVYELPRLNRAPFIADGGLGVKEIHIRWHRWDRERGDTGDPPILWYSVMVQDLDDGTERLAGIVLNMNCQYMYLCNFTITDLIPNTRHAIKVSARRDGEGGDGPPGPSLNATTMCGAPELPPILRTVTSGFEFNSSFPQTELVVTWKDPPRSSWNCDNISLYQITISNAQHAGNKQAVHISGTTPQGRNGIKSASISDLQPATEYCVTMSFQSNRDQYSPESERTCTSTPKTTPSAPRNVKLIRQTSNSLTFSWEKPFRPPADVMRYNLGIWKTDSREFTTKTGKEVTSSAAVVAHTLEDLDPFTNYSIEIRAVNSAGDGDPSPIFVAATAEGLPGPIQNFRNISKTATSIGLIWKDSRTTNGQVLSYLLSCFPVESMSAAPDQHREVNVLPSVHRHTFSNLVPATKYLCSIHTSTNKGTGPSTRIAVWTKPLDPKEPPTPNIMDHTDTTVTVQLTPSQDQTISFYRMIIENVSSGRVTKRSIPDRIRQVGSDFYEARAQGTGAYIAAELTPDKLNAPFVVGDNKTYRGYYNAPLVPTQNYDIWYGAFSNVDGTLRKSFSKAERAVGVALSVAPAPESNHVPVIIVVLVAFIILILVFALLLFLWRKRHLASEREKAEMPNFGPTIVPEPDTSTPSTPVDDVEAEPLIEHSTGTATDAESEPLYGNTGIGIFPAVKVEDLWDYVKQNKENEAEGLRREYRLIPAGLTASCEVAKKTENKNKNRYGNIIAYDHTRVVIKPVANDIHDDYTNANYIDGYKKSKAYIAAQGPTKPTIDHIWRMAWQEKSKTIIMLTNPTETGKKKCEQYWPDTGKEIYAGIAVELVDVDHLPDFTIRTFQLSKGNQFSELKQYHYTTWPDHGVPRFGNSLLLLRQKIRAYDNLDAGPPIVHCSAGVGRTGTYIAVDVNLDQAKNEGLIDVHNFVQQMRTMRVNMVQTLEQYMFVYDVLLEALICGDTSITLDSYPDTLSELLQYEQSIGKTKLDEQYEVLKLVTNTMERDETTVALRPENIFKNRCKMIVPANRCRPYLMTRVEDYNDYVNASFLNGYRRKDAYIATQMPMPNTVVDFWRMIYDHNSYCIVMLNEVDPHDEMMEQYWTLDTCGEKYGPFIVETTAEIKSDPSITVRDFTITNTQNPQEVPRVVRQFHFHRWPEMSVIPSSRAALLELLDQVEIWQKQSGNRPVTVHCLDGATRSGLFVATSCVLERMKTDREVDIFQAIKQLRLNRTQIIDCLEQYRFCHEIALEYHATVSALTTFS
ncbi:receptor-type tyrosine-protein phosphatase S-like isoform X1 [Mizuhopecten yessoensis]|uniref:protein-tyrosine-phosphatase n=2 Tax=Mizuhopecten yessoensis TaxID=6573 RepID=A0A210PGF3_MIZYE|nr:receptor-type tyrosine-protein phosphatase S-like isoform X1 [Mizuhopecten yessoensis]OWF35537.1 Receptor-type tyrosine-protein phosphatase mu [Mizuhopecten yessoensis]